VHICEILITFVTHGLSGNSNNLLEACWGKKLEEGADRLLLYLAKPD
jgi:hypothetical protein